jgi:hypothetical protein
MSPENYALWYSHFVSKTLQLIMKLNCLQVYFIKEIFIHSEIGVHVMAEILIYRGIIYPLSVEIV